jgi:hypothetical protein
MVCPPSLLLAAASVEGGITGPPEVLLQAAEMVRSAKATP